MDEIVDQAALRAHFGVVARLAETKALPHLDRHCRAFIALSPFLVLATADAQGGNVDASPRGDAPGFALVMDDSTLLIPDRPGNRRVDSFQNVIAGGGVGIVFFVPGINETVRVNGRGRVVTDKALLAPCEAQGKVPTAGLLVAIEEVFFHCAKALIRAKLWDASQHVERSSFPTLGTIIAEQTKVMSGEAADATIAEAYRSRLY